MQSADSIPKQERGQNPAGACLWTTAGTVSPRGGVKSHGHGHPKDLAGRPLPAAGAPIGFSIELSLVLGGGHLSR